MANEYRTFRIFPDNETAQDLALVLKEANIPYLIEEDALVFDASYANHPLNRDYRLKLRQEDFGRANEVLEIYYKEQLDKVDPDYYLFSFTDEELQEILAKPDEWGHLDYQLAMVILQKRGKALQPQQTQELREKRLGELTKPEGVSGSSLLFAYVFGILFFPVGIFIGWNWANARKTLPDGNKVPVYTAAVQKHGLVIFVVAVALLILTVVGKMLAMA